MPSPDVEELAPESIEINPPKLPKEAKQLAQRLDGLMNAVSTKGSELGSASEGSPEQGAESRSVDLGEARGSLGWVWPAVGVVFMVALAIGLWWWWRRKSKEPSAPPSVAVERPDAWRDWRAFRRALPPMMRRVLDDFQPVIVLGNHASEKARVIEQLTGFEDVRKFHGKGTRLEGKALDLCLGGSSLVIAPSDAFLEDASFASDAGWQSVLRAVSRIRTPRIVVCLSHTAMDAGRGDELIAHAGVLRAHIDLVCIIRGAHIEVSTVVAQAKRTADARSGRDESVSHVLFELLRELTKRESELRALRIDLSDLKVGLEAEQRKKDGAAWAREKLQAYYRGWSTLFAREGQDAENTLALVRLFEHLDGFSVALGGVLAELFARPEAQLQCGQGRFLYLLPAAGERLVGTIDAFDGPRPEEETRWYPSATLRHRLWVATGVILLSGLVYWKFTSDQEAWDVAAKAALRYDPPNALPSINALAGSGAGTATSAVPRPSEAHEIRAVQEHFNQSCTLGECFGLPDFFDRESPRKYVVERIRQFLRDRIRVAGRAPPEVLLQLAALHVTSTPANCEIAHGPREQDQYDRLSRTIKDNAEDWRAVTGLGVSEIGAYLDLACPDVTGDLETVFPATVVAPPAVARAADLTALLQDLQGGCRNVEEDEAQFRRIEALLSGDKMVGMRQRATLSVLDQMMEFHEGTIRAVYERFAPYRERFKALEDLGEQEKGIELLLADIAPFRVTSIGGNRLRTCTLAEFNRTLEAVPAVPEPAGERALHMKFHAETYVVDRGTVRESLRYVAFARLVREFVRCVSVGGGDPFGLDRQKLPPYVWLEPSRGGLDGLRRSVPGQYTVQALSTWVKAPLGDLERLEGELSCSGTDGGSGVGAPGSRALNDLVRRSLAEYASAYEREWRAVYDSFVIRGQDSRALVSLLDELARPTSPQLRLFREVVEQSKPALDENSQFGDALASLANRYAAVATAIQDASFEAYRVLLSELGSAVATAGSEGASSRAGAPGGRAGEPSRAADAAATLTLFASKLSVLGRSVFEGQVGPNDDLGLRVVEWTKSAGIPVNQRAPFLEPFEMAAELGCADVRGELKSWWNDMEKELTADFLGRFPFAVDATSDAEVESLVEWLHPVDGRFAIEIAPVFTAAAKCGTTKASLAGHDTYGRLKSIQRALFDGNGKPRRLEITLLPMALKPGRGAVLSPSGVVLSVEGQRYHYFNTAPQRFDVAVPWDSLYTAELAVTVLKASGNDVPLAPLSEPNSSWSMFHLLRKAARGESPSEFLLSIPDDSGTPSKSARVGYHVCQGGQRCDGLFDEVLAWPGR